MPDPEQNCFCVVCVQALIASLFFCCSSCWRIGPVSCLSVDVLPGLTGLSARIRKYALYCEESNTGGWITPVFAVNSTLSNAATVECWLNVALPQFPAELGSPEYFFASAHHSFGFALSAE